MLVQGIDGGPGGDCGVGSVAQPVGQQQGPAPRYGRLAPLVAADFFAGLGYLHGAGICLLQGYSCFRRNAHQDGSAASRSRINLRKRTRDGR